MRALVAAIAVATLAGCEVGAEDSTRFAENGIALQVPSTWSVTGFSVDVSPRRLVAASYDVRPSDVEGDCGGQAAIQRLPNDGVYLVIIDYGPGNVDPSDFSDELPISSSAELFGGERFAEFECFGPSFLFRFAVEGRALQAHVGVGSDATATRRDEALKVLNSITVERDG